jgi:dolichyl-phosphate beta-glucosyltransferase
MSPMAQEPTTPTGTDSLSVVLPAYQQANTIASAVHQVRAACADHVGKLEVIVVDDGSTDHTEGSARIAGADLVIRHPVNLGKGAAVRTGMLASSGQVVAFTDADMAYAPAQLLALAAAVGEGADVAVGSRRLGSSETLHQTGQIRKVTSKLFAGFVRAAIGISYSDSQCGIKAFSARVVPTLFGSARVDRFAFDVEILALADRLGLKVVEVPVTVDYGSPSTVSMVRDAPRMALDLLTVRLRVARFDPKR